jgi:hypothetical protein
MEKINFTDFPNTDTPIDATNLNQVQDNVEAEINKTQTNIEKTIPKIDILTTSIKSGETYTNEALKNAKVVIVNWHHSVANWAMQTIHIVGGYCLNTYSTTSCGSNYNSENGTILYQYSTHTDAMVINKILVIK